MRILRDDIYLFSVARSCPGTVVACRAANGEGVIGKNITDILALDADDVSYAMSRSGNEEYRSVCLSCYQGKKQKAVAFFDFACRSASICLAVVFDFKPQSAAKALSALGAGNADLSPSLLRLCNDRFSKEDHEAFTYISYVYGCIAPLGELRAHYEMSSPEILHRAVEYVADLIGVDFNYSVGHDCRFLCYESDGAVFAGGFSSAVMLIAAMLARRYSTNGVLDVDVVTGLRGASVRFSFDTKDDDALESADMLDAVAESYGIYFAKSVRNNKAEMILTPFYSDIGLAGVKERDPYPPISFFYE